MLDQLDEYAKMTVTLKNKKLKIIIIKGKMI